MRTTSLVQLGLLLAIGLAAAACGDDSGGGTGVGGSGGDAPATSTASSTTTGGVTTSATTGSSTATSSSSGGQGGGGEGGAGEGGAGTGGAGGASLVCGDGLVVPGERCGVAMGIADTDQVSNLIIADIDEDGDGDILNASQVIRNDGGSFTVTTIGATSGGRIAVGHVDDDGHLDMVVPMLDTVEIRLGAGDGTFAEPLVLPLDIGAGQDAAIGDVSGDGLADVVVISLDAAVAIYVADGDGGYEVDEHALGLDWLIEVEIADLDDDGANEIVVAEEYNVVDVWDGVEWTPYSSISPFRQIALVDLDDDGALDLVGSAPEGQSVEVLPGDGERGFEDPVVTDLPFVSRSLAAGDFDGDGLIDVAVGSIPLASDDPAVHQLAFLYGEDGGFEPIVVHDILCDVRNFGVGDLNQDGLPDLAGVCNGETGPTSVATGAGGGGDPFPSIGLWVSDP